MSRQHHHDKWRVFLNKLSKKAGNVTQKSPETAKSVDRYRQQASKKRGVISKAQFSAN
jgi:hypothetical protein